jgi:hypothetical protein
MGCVAIAVVGAFAIPILGSGHARHERVQLEPYVITASEAPTLATALSVKGDDAAGLIWAPESGVVIEVHVGIGLRHELRPIVEGIRVDTRRVASLR